MVMTCTHTLSTGVELECRTSGEAGQPLLLFLHGFPEGAFIWDGLLEQFGSRYRCVAPNLRGYGRSSQPTSISDYRAKYLVEDLAALIALESPAKRAACVIAHDWGGAVAWGLANRYPQQLERLLILNSPHPGSFLRELQSNPVQQSASQYMHFLRRPDAPELLAENDELAVFTAWDGKEYYHYKPQMSSLYARILSTANNKMVQVASVVRESSRDYPRPVALEIFEYPPFLFEADALQQCLRDMDENPEYADIKFTESSVGTVYLYSTRYLDEDYAAFLAENEDVGAIASP
mgnify:CR=1 FL=1